MQLGFRLFYFILLAKRASLPQTKLTLTITYIDRPICMLPSLSLSLSLSLGLSFSYTVKLKRMTFHHCMCSCSLSIGTPPKCIRCDIHACMHAWQCCLYLPTCVCYDIGGKAQILTNIIHAYMREYKKTSTFFANCSTWFANRAQACVHHIIYIHIPYIVSACDRSTTAESVWSKW
jgi:hypothetical protein